MNIYDVKLEKLKNISSEEFKKFGYIIGREEKNNKSFRDTPDFTVYSDLTPFLEEEGGRGSLGLIIPKGKLEGDIIDWTEFHEGSYECFFPLGGKQVIFVLAPAGPVPELKETRAFIIGPDEGIVLNKGVWHHPPISLSGKVRCLMPRFGNLIYQNGILKDIETHYYGNKGDQKTGEYNIRIVL